MMVHDLLKTVMWQTTFFSFLKAPPLIRQECSKRIISPLLTYQERDQSRSTVCMQKDDCRAPSLHTFTMTSRNSDHN